MDGKLNMPFWMMIRLMLGSHNMKNNSFIVLLYYFFLLINSLFINHFYVIVFPLMKYFAYQFHLEFVNDWLMNKNYIFSFKLIYFFITMIKFIFAVLIHFIIYFEYLSFITFDHDGNLYNVIMIFLFFISSFTFIYVSNSTFHKDMLSCHRVNFLLFNSHL